MLKRFGLYDYIYDQNEEFLELMENRSIFGVVEKRSKGKIKFYNKRWAILISSKPLFEDFTDESILENSKM